MTDAYSEHCQTFKIELFAKIVSGCKVLLQKSSILDIWQGFQYALWIILLKVF